MKHLQLLYCLVLELIVQLLKQHPMLDSTLFPPKKAFGNTSAEFVQKRQISLERYLQYLIQTLSPPPPRLLEFLDYKLYVSYPAHTTVCRTCTISLTIYERTFNCCRISLLLFKNCCTLSKRQVSPNLVSP